MSQTNNQSNANIREVYDLIQKLEAKIDARFDKIEFNHLAHLYERVGKIENKIWYSTGALALLWPLFNWIISNYYNK